MANRYPLPDPLIDADMRLAGARRCHELLILAREHATIAGAPRTLARVRLALTSAQGAIRHAEGRTARRYMGRS